MPVMMTPQGPVRLPYPGEPGGGAPSGGPGGPSLPPGGPPSGPPGGGPGGGAAILRQVLELLQQYMKVERDDEDLAVGAKLIAQAQGLLAQQQKERDAVMGGGPGAKMLRRA